MPPTVAVPAQRPFVQPHIPFPSVEDLEWFKTSAGGPLGSLTYKAHSVRSPYVKESSSGNLNLVHTGAS